MIRLVLMKNATTQAKPNRKCSYDEDWVVLFFLSSDEHDYIKSKYLYS